MLIIAFFDIINIEFVLDTTSGTRPLTISASSDDDEGETSSSKNPTPVQDKLKAEIAILESNLNSALLQQRSGLSDENTGKTIDKLHKELKLKKGLLETKKKKALREKQYRKNFKKKLNRIVVHNPEVAEGLKVRQLKN